MSKYAINPNKLPDPAAEERAALDREHAFEDEDATSDGQAGPEDALPPLMFVPDPRYPHGDVDLIEARLAELKKPCAETQPAPDAKERAAQDHPLIASLVAALPPPGAHWSAHDRADWLHAADSLFALVYRLDDVETRAKAA